MFSRDERAGGGLYLACIPADSASLFLFFCSSSALLRRLSAISSCKFRVGKIGRGRKPRVRYYPADTIILALRCSLQTAQEHASRTHHDLVCDKKLTRHACLSTQHSGVTSLYGGLCFVSLCFSSWKNARPRRDCQRSFGTQSESSSRGSSKQPFNATLSANTTNVLSESSP